MKVLRLDMVRVSCAATPKSASFTCPLSVSRMFPHLMSRCTCIQPLRYFVKAGSGEEVRVLQTGGKEEGQNLTERRTCDTSHMHLSATECRSLSYLSYLFSGQWGVDAHGITAHLFRLDET